MIQKCLPLIFAVFLTACGSDDSGTPETNLNLAVIGEWELVEVNISSSQDIDQDGSSSTNLLDEVDCITGTLTLNSDLTWSLTQSGISITAITNDQFFAQCNSNITGSGTWVGSSTQVTFSGSSVLGTLQINSDDRLTNNVGEDLPGIRGYVYRRQ